MQSIYSLLASRQTSLSRANWLNIFQQMPIQKQYDLLEYFVSFDTRMRILGKHRRFAKKPVQFLNEALCFLSSSVQADSLVLRNLLLRQVPNSCMVLQ